MSDENDYEVSVLAYQHVSVTAESEEEAKEKARDEVLGLGSEWEHKASDAHKLD